MSRDQKGEALLAEVHEDLAGKLQARAEEDGRRSIGMPHAIAARAENLARSEIHHEPSGDAVP